MLECFLTSVFYHGKNVSQPHKCHRCIQVSHFPAKVRQEYYLQLQRVRIKDILVSSLYIAIVFDVRLIISEYILKMDWLGRVSKS